MPNPINIINAAVFAADPTGRLGPGAVARVVVETLPADGIVSNAVQALRDDAWEGHPDELTAADLEAIARVVLRSVGA